MRSDLAFWLTTAPEASFYALRSGLCVATLALFLMVLGALGIMFLCPPKRAMRSDLSIQISQVTSQLQGFYALRSGLCVATAHLTMVVSTGVTFLCPPKRAMRSDGPCPWRFG